LERKEKNKTWENVYLITMINPNPRQIAAFEVCKRRTDTSLENLKI
jgi:hypothetical protein